MALNDNDDSHDQKRCVVKAILPDEVDPNEIPLEAIHASSVRMMNKFVQHPSRDLTNAVIRMLDVIACHQDAFKPESGHNVYSRAAMTWRGIVDTMREMNFVQASRIVH